MLQQIIQQDTSNLAVIVLTFQFNVCVYHNRPFEVQRDKDYLTNIVQILI